MRSLYRKHATWNYHQIGKCDYNVYVSDTESILLCLLLGVDKTSKLYKLFCGQSVFNMK